jgi:hypothetical protein
MRPRNIFVWPKLDSEFNEKTVFWPIFLRVLMDCGPKYEEKADLRPKDQLGLDAPVLKYLTNLKPNMTILNKIMIFGERECP